MEREGTVKIDMRRLKKVARNYKQKKLEKSREGAKERYNYYTSLEDFEGTF